MPLNVQLLLTGSELMSGDITDTNSVFMSQELLEQGIDVRRKVTVADDMQQLEEEISSISLQADVLVINGGLGPTTDDLTAEALARVAGVSLTENAESKTHLESWCARRGFALDKSNLKQAMLPEGIRVLPNPVGSAVGFSLEHNGCLIICTPGVPSEMKHMWTDSVVPAILEKIPDEHFSLTRYFPVFGVGEAPIQDRLTSVADWPDTVETGYRAGAPLVDVKLTIRHPDHKDDLDRAEASLIQLLGTHIISNREHGLGGTLVDLLKAEKKTVTCAESCTGGKIASLITAVPGSSEVFEAGYVTYSNRIKTKALGVRETTLEANGAVSEAVVKEMLAGALEQSGADIGVAVSGVAGPGGGSEEKPVGTVWIAWGSGDSMKTVQFYYPGTRSAFQMFVATAALDLMRRDIQKLSDTPAYFARRRR